MKIENSPFQNKYLKKLVLPYGDFYVFEHFVVSEIYEGVHFDWNKASHVIENVHSYFDKALPTNYSYISNRVNSYSVTPQDWLKFYQERHTVNKVAIVAYNEKGILSIALEKMFTKANYKTFKTLQEAMHWMQFR